MDEIASRARISKASLYREHPSKDALFAAVVAHWAASGRHAMRPVLDRLAGTDDLPAGLSEWAHLLVGALLHPAVIEMRRLVIAEAARHPEVGAAYLEQSWRSNITDLAGTLQQLAGRGLLRVGDAELAAEQLTWLVAGGALNARLLDPAAGGTAGVDRAVELFLAAHHPGDGVLRTGGEGGRPPRRRGR